MRVAALTKKHSILVGRSRLGEKIVAIGFILVNLIPEILGEATVFLGDSIPEK
jgi:hypothetical protein